MIRYLVHRAPVVFAFSVLIVFSGILSYIRLPRESAPEIKQPYIFVTTAFPGVAAQDVENLVTRVIEDEISGVDGLIEMTSSSQQSLSFIFTKFASDITVETALRRVQQRVDRARPFLPTDIEETVVQELSSSSFPILIIALSNPSGLEVLDKAADDLAEELRRVRGVLGVEITGKSEKQVRIELDPGKLNYYGLSIDDVISAVQNGNVAVPGGLLKSPPRNYTISVNSEIRDQAQFNDIIVQRENVRVMLRELGTVSFAYAEPVTYSRFNGNPAISLSLTKRSGENIVHIVDRVRAITDTAHSRFPQGTSIDYVYDESDYIRQIILDLENNMFSGFILVMLVTIFFMGFINSLFVSLAIPFSMLLSFSILELLGVTLNMVVLFSLILALGMLVDNGIVIVENIFRHGSMGKSQIRAAIDGATEVASPIFTSTLTTCLAFFPIIFMPDVMGDFMAYVPITVIVVLASSLLVALTINPVFCSRFLRVKDSKQAGKMSGGRFYQRLVTWYGNRLTRSMDHSGLVLLVSFVIVITGFILYGFFGKEPIFFPEPDPSEAIISVELPQGTPLEKTDSFVRHVEMLSKGVPASLKNIQSTSGRAGDGDIFAGTGEEFNKGFVRLSFKPYTERTIKGRETMQHLNQRLSGVAGAKITVREQETGPPSGNDISYEIIGDDYSVLGRYADSIMQILGRFPELRQAETDFEPAKPELTVIVDRKLASHFQLTARDIAGVIRTAMNGTTISSFRQGEEEYDVVMRYGKEYRSSVADLQRVHIVDQGGIRIPLTSVASVNQTSSIAVIKRRDLQRSVGVWADFNQDVQNRSAIQAQIENAIREIRMPQGYRIGTGTGLEMRQEATDFLIQAFMIALFLIAIVMIAQFNSIGQPVIILISVFLSMGGVFWGYFLSRQTFVVIMSGIGSIALAGVAVNNCIVLVDYTNRLIKEGSGIRDAVIEAGKTRFRPVLLTASTTVLGLLPMAFGVSFDIHPSTFGIQVGSEMTEFWTAFAWAMIFGLSFATVMTLIMVPNMLSMYFTWFPPKKIDDN